MSKLISLVVTAVVSYFAGPVAGAAAGNYAGQMSQLMLNGQYDWGRALRLGLNPFGGNKEDLARSIYDPGSHGAPGRIDYKSIGVSAAAAAVTAGVSQYASYLGMGTYASLAVQTTASYAANYQLSKWAGYDVSWSNRQLGANLAAAFAGRAMFGGGKTENGSDGASDAPARTPTSGNESFQWRTVAVQAVRNIGQSIVRSGIQYGMEKAFGVKDASWGWGNVAADAFGNALSSAVVGGLSDWRASRNARALMDQQLYDAVWADGNPFANPYDMTAAQRDSFKAMLDGAVAGPGGGAPSPLTRARRDYAVPFDSGLKKLGLGKPTVLYSETISTLLRLAQDGGGYVGLQLNSDAGRKTSLSVEEVKAMAAYIRAAGVEGAYTDVAPDAMVMLVPVEATKKQLVSELREHAGNLLMDGDISNLIGSMEFDVVTGRSETSASFNLMPLRRELISRFDERLLANENVVEAAIAVRYANAENVDATSMTLFSAPTEKEIALQNLDDVIRQERDNMIGAGFMPTKDGNSELIGNVYKEIANAGIDFLFSRLGGRMRVGGSLAIGQLRDAAVDRAADVVKARVEKELDNSIRTEVGVPYARSADPTSWVQEYDVDGNEIFYRAMDPAHLRRLMVSGSKYEIVPTGETGISSLDTYSKQYKGAVVRFAVKPGTAAALYKIGLAADGSEAHYPDLRSVHHVDWQQKYVQFKSEGGVPNILLGKGAGIEIFRSNIVGYTVVRQGRDK